MNRWIALGLLVAVAGCDPSAKASGEGGALGDEQRSQLGESCATSLHCAGGLRCLDQVCRAAKASTLGEFHEAAGDQAMARDDLLGAIEQYTEAVNQFEADKIEPPAELHCKLGAALTEDREDRVNGELAATYLHKCLIAAPAGTKLRARAMRHLALLLEVGLDPLLLARSEPADAYLTKQPLIPSVEDLTVSVTAEGREPRSRTYSNWLEYLGKPVIKQALAPCYEQYRKDTREPRLTVQLPFRHSFRLTQYDDFDRSTLEIDDVPAGSDAIAEAHRCAKNALAPVADEWSKDSYESRWSAVLNITIGE